jgi:hypothetical protein
VFESPIKGERIRVGLPGLLDLRKPDQFAVVLKLPPK